MSTLRRFGAVQTVVPLDYNIGVARLTKRKMEDYLLKNLNELTDGLRTAKGWKIDDIDVKVSIDRIGKYYLFVLSFPETVLEESQKRYQDRPSWSRPYSESSPRLLQPIYEFLNKLTFDKDECQDMRSATTKKKYHFTEKEQSIICRYLRPTVKRQRIDDTTYSQLVVAINPLKLFWNMLEPKKDAKGNVIDPGSDFKYKVQIREVKEIGVGNYQFTVYRVPDLSDTNTKGAKPFSVASDIARQNSGKNFRSRDDRRKSRRKRD